MTAVPHFKILAVLALLLALILVWRSLRRRELSAASKLNLDDLLIDPATGKISKAAAVMMGSFLVTSWSLVYAVLSGKDAYPYYWAYCLTWAAPAVVKLISERPGGTPPTINPP
jgi:hypothetical protein